MSIFNVFNKRKNPNPQAVNKPERVRDSRPASSYKTSQDSTSFSVIDRIASEFAMLSYGVYDSKGRKLEKHPLLSILKRPNLEDMHFNFFYQSIVDYYNGGIYWLKVYGTQGQLVSLFRLNPLEVSRNRDISNGNRYIYLYNGKMYTDDDIMYIPARYNYSTLSGGASIFKAASGTFETTTKLDKFTNNSFDKGMNGKRTVIDISQAYPDATKKQVEELRSEFEETYTGVENAGKPLFKKKGMEYTEIGSGTDNRSATLIENRQFQEHEISKLFAFPSELLSGATSNINIENMFLMLLEFAVKPLAIQIQEYINLLFDDGDYSYFEFNFNGMLKVSLSQRIDAYVKERSNGMLTTNEIRAMEDRPPVEGGDTVFTPVNLMPMNDETINAYMAKQKNEIQKLTDSANDDKHFAGGDDKQ